MLCNSLNLFSSFEMGVAAGRKEFRGQIPSCRQHFLWSSKEIPSGWISRHLCHFWHPGKSDFQKGRLVFFSLRMEEAACFRTPTLALGVIVFLFFFGKRVLHLIFAFADTASWAVWWLPPAAFWPCVCDSQWTCLVWALKRNEKNFFECSEKMSSVSFQSELV